MIGCRVRLYTSNPEVGHPQDDQPEAFGTTALLLLQMLPTRAQLTVGPQNRCTSPLDSRDHNVVGWDQLGQ